MFHFASCAERDTCNISYRVCLAFFFFSFFNNPFYRAISIDGCEHAREVLCQNKVHLINYLTREMFAQPVPSIFHVTMQALPVSNH